MSRTFTALIILLTGVISLNLASSIETYGHEYGKTTTTKVGIHAVETLVPRSLLDCSSLCLNLHWSAYYIYNKENGSCTCANRVSNLYNPPSGNDQLYTHRLAAQCPIDADVNFNVYVYRDTVLCLRISELGEKFKDAEDQCASFLNLITSTPGRLVKSDTMDKLEILARADDIEGTLSTNNMWVGMQDIETEMTFFWSDEVQVTQEEMVMLFSDNQPSDQGYQMEDCVNFLRMSHKLNDAYCGHKYRFICEVPLDPNAQNG